jgi:NAD-dependent deacetylase
VPDGDIEELARLVQCASNAVVFTGAGISTDAGIPDFRSPGGFWTRHKPIAFSDFMASAEARLEAWRRFLMIHEIISAAAPGPGHRAVAELVARGHVSCVITQNIDGLDAAAGVPTDRIIEIHGSGTHAKCLDCGVRHEISWVRGILAEAQAPPACMRCGGIVKSATVSFGQAMPEHEMAAARAATLKADLFLAIGSSLQVFPAAGLPVLASHNRTPLVIINREETGLDGLAQLVVRGEISAVLEKLMQRLAAE